MTKTVTYKGKTYEIDILPRQDDVLLTLQEFSHFVIPHNMSEFLSNIRSLIQDYEDAIKFKADLETWDGNVPEMEVPF